MFIIDQLLKDGAIVSAFDPEAMNNVKKVVGDKITYCDDAYSTIKDADALLIATEWSVSELEFDKYGKYHEKQSYFRWPKFI